MADFTTGRQREKERPREWPGTEDGLCTPQILGQLELVRGDQKPQGLEVLEGAFIISL